jgi:urease accessory protein
LKGGPVGFALAVGFAAAPTLAHAHVGVGATTGFLTGLLHLSGLDHIIAMIAVGLWGAQLGAPAIWMLPVTFPVVMAFGGLLGLIGVPLPSVEIGIALSGVLLGAAVMTESRPPLWVAAALVALFAIYHGHSHGAELPPETSALTYSIGFVIATGLLHASGIGVGTIHRWSFGRLALRALGGLITFRRKIACFLVMWLTARSKANPVGRRPTG